MLTIEKIMTTSPVIPVMVVEHIEDAVPMAKALVSGGLKVLEVTLRTACALEAINQIKASVPEAIVGAGTVVTPQDLAESVHAGSEFLVSPGCTPQLLDAALHQSVPLLPGVVTPSEAMGLLARGVSAMKFFPAEAAGGIAMLKSIAGPLPQIKFCPTGGINKASAPNYLALENVLCVGGSWMLDKALVNRRDWATIKQQALEAAQL